MGGAQFYAQVINQGCNPENAQHSVHQTVGILRDLQAFSTPQQFSALKQSTLRPAAGNANR